MRPRAIPVLLIEDKYVVKTKKFRHPVYLGDPINSVKLFNEKQADELTILDIAAGQPRQRINYAFIEQVATEAFMPVAYGGGITTLEEATRLFNLGVEKVVVNAALVTRPDLLSEIAENFGAQSVVASMDVAHSRRGHTVVYDRGRKTATRQPPQQWAAQLELWGAGEILLTSVAREGTCSGYDLQLISSVSAAVRVPIVAHGGAASLVHFREALDAGASAVAAGSFFVFHGEHRAVLITYPSDAELTQVMEGEG